MSALSPEPTDDWLLGALERYEKPLLKYALGLCGDRELSRDTVQDTFLKLAAEPLAERPQNLPAWLFSVCRNRLIDIRRKQFRLVPLEDGHLEQDLDGVPAPSARLEASEQSASLLRMADDEELKVEGLAIRNFCHRAELLLPPVTAPGWWERRRLQRVFSVSAPGRGLAGFGAAAAAVAMILALFQRPAVPGLPVTDRVVLSLDGVGPINDPRMTGGSRDLVTAATALTRVDNVDPEPGPDVGHNAEGGDALPAAVPEVGPLILAQSQPYLLAALLRGPVAARPDRSRTGAGGFLAAGIPTGSSVATIRM